MPFVYIVKCCDDTLYTGWTVDLEQRIAQHNAGKGARYTKGRGPVTLCYFEEVATPSEALRREYQIKQLSRTEKLALIRSQNEKHH